MDHHKVNHKKTKRDKKRKLEAERAVGPDTSEFVGAVESIMNGQNDSTDNINESEHAAVLEDSHTRKKSMQEKPSEASGRPDFANNNTSPPIPTLPVTKKERVIKPSSLWNFTVDYNDHFETPPIAYKDLSPVLEALSAGVGKTTGELTVYDPYWCEGSMVSHMRELGYKNVINRNRDFYLDIKKKNIPEYDILVTNPPYSGEHKVNLLKFLATHTSNKQANNNTKNTGNAGVSSAPSNVLSKPTSGGNNKGPDNVQHTLPFALLLPVYTATKSYWKDFAQAQALVGKNAFYILPPDYYEYSHPEGTGKDIPPFYSAWFLGGFSHEQKNSIIQSLRTKPRTAIPAKPTIPPLKRLSFPVLTVAESVEALVSRGVVTDSKRPNPKQRQKMKQMGK